MTASLHRMGSQLGGGGQGDCAGVARVARRARGGAESSWSLAFWRLTLGLVLVVAVPGVARAHPLALSGFDAWAEERDLRIELKLDAASVLLVLEAAHPGRAATLATIRGERAILVDYIAGRFR